ncbi:hypothetical protein MauCBS54593_003436 [Microsporum audouinii]
MEEMLQVQMFTAEDLFPLWKNGTGLCTSFAIYIASRLENSDHPTLFQFAELNGIHRACFSRDGTIIDSSARKILEVKDEKPISGYKGHWNLDKSSNDLTLLFKASKSSKFTAFQPLQSYVKAMHNCILQLCDQESFLCLFRIKVGIQLRFNGMITWKPCQRRISWSGLLPNKTSNKMQIYEHSVQFSTVAEGTEKEELISACLYQFVQFCEHESRAKQYAQVKQIILNIWSSSINNFRYGICSEGWK